MGRGLHRAVRATKRTRYPDTPEVAPRQVWADNDKRAAGREVRVDRVENDFAYCTVIKGVGGVAVSGTTRIHLDRFFPTTTGYRYLRVEPAS